MLSDIAVKSSSMATVAMYEKLNRLPLVCSPSVVCAASVVVPATDIFLDTIKHPAFIIENGMFAVVNLMGSPCFESCCLEDFYRNLQNMGIGTLTSCVSLLIAIPKLLVQINETWHDPAHARPYNKENAVEAASFNWVLKT